MIHNSNPAIVSKIGLATTSARADRSPWLIKTLGQWNSDAYMITYIYCPFHVLSTIASQHKAWSPDEQ